MYQERIRIERIRRMIIGKEIMSKRGSIGRAEKISSGGRKKVRQVEEGRTIRGSPGFQSGSQRHLRGTRA